MPEVNGALPQPNNPEVDGALPQPNNPEVDGALPQPNNPEVDGALPQPNNPEVDGALPQPNNPEVDGALPQPNDPSASFAADLRASVIPAAPKMGFQLLRHVRYEISGPSIWYEFKINTRAHQFIITCEPREEIVNICGFKPFGRRTLVGCQTVKKCIRTTEDDRTIVTEYGSTSYPESVDKKTCQLLMKYLIEEQYSFSNVNLELPLKQIERGLEEVRAADSLTMEVVQSVLDENFLASWLNVIGVSYCERVFLDVRHNQHIIFSNEVACNQLKWVRDLVIRGKTDIRFDFLLDFRGSFLEYSDASRNYIKLKEWATWWSMQRQRQLEPPPRRIIFRTPHEINEWDHYKAMVYQGVVQPNETHGRFEHIFGNQRHLFEITREQLTIIFERT